MKRTLAALLAGVALAGATLSVSAQTLRNEVSLFGSWEDIDEPAKLEQTHLFARYGRFVSPQLVGTLGLQRSRFEGSGLDATSMGVTIGAKYYLNEPRAQRLSPFLDASVGLANTDNGRNDDTDFTWELGGGVSWFFTEATSFDAALRLFHTSTEVDTKGSRILLGITTRF